MSRQTITSAAIADGTVAAVDLAAGVAASNVGTLGGALGGTLPNPTLAANSVGANQITDGTVGTAELANGAVTNAKLASDTARANLLTNGGFEVWQRGNGPFTGANTYTADRWFIEGSTLSVSRDTANVDAGSGVCAAVTNSSGAAALSQQYTDQWNQLQTRTLSWSVRVRTSTANAVRLRIDGSATGTPGAYHSGSGTYQTITVTQTITGTYTPSYLRILIDVPCTAYIDNAMLVVGSVPADYAPLHPADDLARCQRYYQVTSGASLPLVVGMVELATQALLNWIFPTTMGGTPTFTMTAIAGSNFCVHIPGSNIAITSLAGVGALPWGVQFSPNTAGGLTPGWAAVLYSPAGFLMAEYNP